LNGVFLPNTTFMKRILITGLISVILFSSCKKKSYLYFSQKQLVFVNYSKGQALKFIDTASLLQPLSQYKYRREFREQVGLFGKTGALLEEYEVAYRGENSGSFGLQISVNAISSSLSIEFASYFNIVTSPDSLQSTIPSMIINGKTYTDIYTLKMYKNQDLNNSDTATLFHNKEYGVIELLFPDGKKIVRAD
jgi:hypothetical protein